MLREALERRLARRLHGMDPEAAFAEREAALPLIEAELDRLVAAGLIDDARFAEMKARSALAAGRGIRRILTDLSLKGISPEIAQDAVAEASRDSTGRLDVSHDIEDVVVSAEWEAAETFARKRRIGPYRRAALQEGREARAKQWRREAASMSRAGFDLDIIRQILDRDPAEDED